MRDDWMRWLTGRDIEAEQLVERVAKSLYEYATWHPPAKGEEWGEAAESVKAQWRDEARSVLEGH